MKQTKFSAGLLVGVIVGTAASIACSDAATDMMGSVMRDAGGALVDAGIGLMDAGGEVRDASEAMLDAARAEGDVNVREITCDRTSEWTDASASWTSTQKYFYALVPVPGRSRLSGKRVEVISCDIEYFDRSAPDACLSSSTCSGSRPDLGAFCSRTQPHVADGTIYVECGSRQDYVYPAGSTNPPFSYGSRYRHVYLLTED